MCRGEDADVLQACFVRGVWEGDATGIGKYYIKATNLERECEIHAWKLKHRRMLPSYFQVFVRLGGIVHRASGMCFVQRLCEKLTPPRSRPPQED